MCQDGRTKATSQHNLSHRAQRLFFYRAPLASQHRPEAYSQLVEANANVAPLVQEDILKLHGITTAKGFAQYMGSEVLQSSKARAFKGQRSYLTLRTSVGTRMFLSKMLLCDYFL